MRNELIENLGFINTKKMFIRILFNEERRNALESKFNTLNPYHKKALLGAINDIKSHDWEFIASALRADFPPKELSEEALISANCFCEANSHQINLLMGQLAEDG